MAKQQAIKRSLLPVFTKRFISLYGENETQEEFGYRLGLSRNTIAQYLNGHRIPDSITLKQICERCNVSADWLLGLSDVKKPDIALQGVCEYTGLSEKAIEIIRNICNQPTAFINDGEKLIRYAGYFDQSFLESVLTTNEGLEMLSSISKYKRFEMSNPCYFDASNGQIQPLAVEWENICIPQQDGTFYHLGYDAYEKFLLQVIISKCEAFKQTTKEEQTHGELTE